MDRLTILKWLLVLATCLGVAPAFADSVTVTLDPKTLNSPAQGGVVVAPYYLDIHSPGDTALGLAGNSTVTAICDDYLDHVTSGEVWTANVVSLGSGNLSSTYFNDPTRYEQAAWLSMQTGLFAGYTPQKITGGPTTNSIANINFAIWALMEPYAVNSSTPGYVSGVNNVNSADWWLNEAKLLAPTSLGFYSGVDILTPVPPNGMTAQQELASGTAPQEYITIVPTPEPASLVMICTGGLAAFRQRRRIYSAMRSAVSS